MPKQLTEYKNSGSGCSKNWLAKTWVNVKFKQRRVYKRGKFLVRLHGEYNILVYLCGNTTFFTGFLQFVI